MCNLINGIKAKENTNRQEEQSKGNGKGMEGKKDDQNTCMDENNILKPTIF